MQSLLYINVRCEHCFAGCNYSPSGTTLKIQLWRISSSVVLPGSRCLGRFPIMRFSKEAGNVLIDLFAFGC